MKRVLALGARDEPARALPVEHSGFELAVGEALLIAGQPVGLPSGDASAEVQQVLRTPGCIK